MNDFESAKEAVMALVLAATAAPFVAAGMTKQKAFEEADRVIEAAKAFVEGRDRSEG